MSDPFQKLVSYTQASQEKYGASASALFIIQDDDVVTEWYSGQHHFKRGALPVTRESMFNLYSIRKSYVGMATAIAVIDGNISIDTVVADIVKDMPATDLKGVTIRDLATKTNVKYFGPQRIEREEVAGKLIQAITGKTISQLITERVFQPLELNQSEWVAVPKPVWYVIFKLPMVMHPFELNAMKAMTGICMPAPRIWRCGDICICIRGPFIINSFYPVKYFV